MKEIKYPIQALSILLVHDKTNTYEVECLYTKAEGRKVSKKKRAHGK